MGFIQYMVISNEIDKLAISKERNQFILNYYLCFSLIQIVNPNQNNKTHELQTHACKSTEGATLQVTVCKRGTSAAYGQQQAQNKAPQGRHYKITNQ